MSLTIASLADLLRPYSEEEFLRRNWHQAFTYIEGTEGRFEGLLPWEALDTILAQHRLEPPRLKIVKEGVSLDSSTFISYPLRRNHPFEKIPELDPVALTAHLREGASLILNHVDELWSPLTRLVANLEGRLRIGVAVNAYAGWRTTRGLDLHWDDHDVLILQIYGRKSWKLYEASRPYPLARDLEPKHERPTSSPIWEGDLTSGDVLYIPRGVWHVAIPLDEPTLHLTFGFTRATGEQLFEWLRRRLRDEEAFRKDLPRLEGKDAYRAHALSLRQAFDALWSPDILEQYLAAVDQSASPRPRASLPFGAMAEPFGAAGSNRYVEWHTARRSQLIDSGDGSVRLKAHGREWEFDALAGPLLEFFMAGGRHSVSALYHRFGGEISEEQISEFLGSLLHDGLIVTSG